MPSLVTGVLGAPVAVLGLIEGIADALSGAAKLVGGPLADDPARRRNLAAGGYTLTAVLSAAIGLSTAVWQVAILRAGAWSARGLRGPARNALMADAVEPEAYGRAYGFERAMDNLGAVGGPLLAIVLVGVVGIRGAIVLSVIPGLLAVAAILYAVRHLRTERPRQTQPVRLRVAGVLRGRVGRVLATLAAFEAGNVALTLLILRATDLLSPSLGAAAVTTVLLLYAGHNVAASLGSIPAGRVGDRMGFRAVLAVGFGLFALSYATFAAGPADPLVLGLAFASAGLGIGAVETAENASVAHAADPEVRGSAFGWLAALQSAGDLVASAVAGLLWTLVSPTAAFAYAAAWMLVALAGLAALPSQSSSRSTER
jgi:MFS family permease